MSVIVTRAGKGAPLSWIEADANFTNLNLDKVEETELASTIGSSMVGYLPDGTGTVITTVQSKLRESVSVKDFGAVGDGITDDTAAFNLAAAAGAQVLVPKGDYLISAPTSSALWVLERGAVIVGLPNAGTAEGGVNDTSRLTGSIASWGNIGVSTLKVGASNPWLAKDNIRDTVDFLAEFSSVSDDGGTGGMFATKSSDNLTANMQTIALEAISYNNNTTNPEPSWSIYTETIRAANAGPAFGAEMDFVNLGNTYNLSPYGAVDPYSSTLAPTASLWLSCGGGDSDLAAGANNISAAIVTLPNAKKFNAGWVVRDGSIESRDIVVAPTDYFYTWNAMVGGKETNTANLNDRQHFRAVYSDTKALAVADISRKYKANGTSATQASDVIYTSAYQGYSGSAPIVGAQVLVQQLSDFSGATATFSHVLFAANAGGGNSDVGLNVGTVANFAPYSSDNALSLGTAAHRWTTVFAGNGTINTSDAREKQDVEELNAAEIRVAKSIKGLIRKFRFKDAVQEKGEAARIHFGVIAQDVKSAFEAEGLIAEEYGVLCHDSWEEQEEVIDGAGQIVRPHISAGDRYGIRYDELLIFLISAF